jgi:uncharacterized protein (TIGR03435 family)
MPDVNDMELVREYARQASEAAFAELAQRHVNLVYSTAFRHVGIAAHAEEITQAVFIILARKAACLRPDTILEGWLHETARLTALSFMRGERRRQFREQEAYMQSALQESADTPAWNQLSPLLDEAISRLGRKDRDAVMLRFFKGKSIREAAVASNVSEAAAQKRVLRALEKLRKCFTKRGVALSTAAIAGAISANSIQAAPASLAKTATAVALAKGATASTSTLTLIKGALKLMAWTKMKLAIVAGVGVLLAAGTATVAVREIQEHRTYPWQTDHPTPETLDQAPPQIRILPAKYPVRRGPGMNIPRGVIYQNKLGKMFGLTQQGQFVVQAAYNFTSAARFVFPTNLWTELSQKDYDFIASLPQGNAEALQQEVKRKLGVMAKLETRDTDVLLLKVNFPNAPGLKRSTNRLAREPLRRNQHFTFFNAPLSSFATNLIESNVEIPVVDQTGLNGGFDIDLDFKNAGSNKQPDLRETFKQTLLDQLGLELVPTNMPVEMLIVEKAAN